jgi:hypothetical protein
MALSSLVISSLAGHFVTSAGHQPAYIDPGVGAMLLQGLAAVFFGALFYLKNFRRTLARFFTKRKEVPAEASPAPVASKTDPQ